MFKKEPGLNIGDVVYLKRELLEINWRMEEYIELPFVVLRFGEFTNTSIVAPYGEQHFGKEFYIHKQYLRVKEKQ